MYIITGDISQMSVNDKLDMQVSSRDTRPKQASV